MPKLPNAFQSTLADYWRRTSDLPDHIDELGAFADPARNAGRTTPSPIAANPMIGALGRAPQTAVPASYVPRQASLPVVGPASSRGSTVGPVQREFEQSLQGNFSASVEPRPAAPADPILSQRSQLASLERSQFGSHAFGWLKKYAGEFPDFVALFDKDEFDEHTDPGVMPSDPPVAVFRVLFNGERCVAAAPLLKGLDGKFQIPQFAINTSQGPVALSHPLFKHISSLDESAQSNAKERVLEFIHLHERFDEDPVGDYAATTAIPTQGPAQATVSAASRQPAEDAELTEFDRGIIAAADRLLNRLG